MNKVFLCFVLYVKLPYDCLFSIFCHLRLICDLIRNLFDVIVIVMKKINIIRYDDNNNIIFKIRNK